MITFAVRGDGLNARFTNSIKEPVSISSNLSPPSVVIAKASAIGGFVISMGDSFVQTAWNLQRGGWPFPGFSILARRFVRYGGNPAGGSSILAIGSAGISTFHWTVEHLAGGGIHARAILEDAVTPFNSASGNHNPIINTHIDYFFQWDGISGNAARLYVDAILLHSYATSAANNDDGTMFSTFQGGGAYIHGITQSDLGEVIIWDNADIDPTSVMGADNNLMSLNGAARTQFVKVAEFDALAPPQAIDLRQGITVGGVLGTFNDPLPEDVRKDVQWDNLAKIGLSVMPIVGDVRTDTVFDNGSIGELDVEEIVQSNPDQIIVNIEVSADQNSNIEIDQDQINQLTAIKVDDDQIIVVETLDQVANIDVNFT